MRYLLDTNACIALINRTDARIAARLLTHHAEDIVTSVICAAELHFGVERSRRRAEAARRLDVFLRTVRALPLDLALLETYGRIRAHLVRRGKPIGPLDTLIAAHAVCLDLVLVTANEREFRRVPDLVVENWAKG